MKIYWEKVVGVSIMAFSVCDVEYLQAALFMSAFFF